MNQRLFLTDLDGTLLDSSGRLSTYAARVITRLLSLGHVVSFATARSLVSAKPLVQAVPWRYPAILYDGALMMDPQAEETLWGRFIPTELAESIIDTGRAYGLSAFVYAVGPEGREICLYEALQNEGERGFRESRRDDPRYRLVDRIALRPADQVIQLSFVGPEPLLAEVKEELEACAGEEAALLSFPDTYLKGYSFLKAHHPEASKGKAFIRWSEMVGCDPSEVTVFGDNLNDLSMFEHAGVRVAVANAVEPVRRAADQVIEGNDEDGVARYLDAAAPAVRPAVGEGAP